jgi:hypothetical protein
MLVIESLKNEFSFGRGLKHIDSLSSFLFLFATEGLNFMLTTSVIVRLLEGYLVWDNHNSQVQISHLQLVDDTLIVSDKSWAKYGL